MNYSNRLVYCNSRLPALSHQDLLQFTLQLLEQIPEEYRALWLGDWYFEQRVATSNPEQMMAALHEFEAQSLRGTYYRLREFNMQGESPETLFWFEEMSRWLDYGCQLGLETRHPLALTMLDTCMRLLDELANDRVVFAHECGLWMLHTRFDYQEVWRQLQTPAQ